jgi:hypothetical protein
MTKTKKTFITIAILVSIVAALALFFWYIVTPHKVSRVTIPGSDMTVIVTADLSGCYSCQLFENGHPISGLQLLGPYASMKCSLEKVSVISNIATIDWSDGYHYRVEVDIAARQFVVQSNSVPLHK